MSNKSVGMRSGKSSKKQRGFTLAELTVVLLIGSLLAAAAIFGLPRILSSIRAEKVISTMNTGIPSIQTAYMNRPNFAGLSTTSVAKNRYLDNFIIEDAAGKATGEIKTSWGDITFSPTNGDGSNATNSEVLVTLTNVPGRECGKIADLFNNSVITTANIGGTSVKARGSTFSLEAAGEACAEATGTAGVAMSFQFARI